MREILSTVKKSVSIYLCLVLIIIGVITGLPVDAQAKMIGKKDVAHQISKHEQVNSNISVTELEEMRASGDDGMVIVLAAVGLLVLIAAMICANNDDCGKK